MKKEADFEKKVEIDEISLNDEKCDVVPIKMMKISEDDEKKDEVNLKICENALKTLEVQKSPIKVTKMKKGAKIRPKCPQKISDFKNSPKSELGPKNVDVEGEESNLVKKIPSFCEP